MKVTADEQRRVTLPEAVHPGDTFELKEEPEGRIVLVREVNHRNPPRVEKEGNHLVFISDEPITLEDTLKALERFP